MPSNFILLKENVACRGGVDAVAEEQSRHLLQYGRVTWLTIEPGVAAVAGVEIVALGGDYILGGKWSSAAILRSFVNFRAAARLSSLIKKGGAGETVVLLHSWTKGLSLVPLFVARWHGVRVHVFLHDYALVCPTGIYFNVRQRRVCTLRPGSLACLNSRCDRGGRAVKLVRYARWQWNRIILHINRHHLCVSKVSPFPSPAWLTETLKPYHVSRISNALRVPCFGETASKEFDFCYVGRGSPEKAADVFLDAAAGQECRIVICGDSDTTSDSLARKARVTRTGWLDAPGVLNRIRRSRCLVFPSLWQETYGLVVAEALACGVPVIVSSVCPIAQFVVDESVGWRVDFADPAAVAKLIAAFLAGEVSLPSPARCAEAYAKLRSLGENDIKELATGDWGSRV